MKQSMDARTRLLLSILATFGVIHILALSSGEASAGYKLVEDTAVIVLTASLGWYSLRQEGFGHLVLACAFIMILTSHILRLIYGGLLC